MMKKYHIKSGAMHIQNVPRQNVPKTKRPKTKRPKTKRPKGAS